MKVYCAWSLIHYEGVTLLGIYFSRRAAEVKAENSRHMGDEQYVTEEEVRD